MNGYRESEDLIRAGWYEEEDASLVVFLKKSSEDAVRYETDDDSVATSWIEAFVARGVLPDQEPAPADTSRLRMINHQAHLNNCGVAVYSMSDCLGREEEPTRDRLLLLSPDEALEFAEYVLAHRTELEGQQSELNAQFKLVGLEVLKVASDLWRRDQRRKGILDIEMTLSHAYSIVTQDESNLAEKWWSATFTGTYSHELQEAQFWRYFYKHYHDQFFRECFPESDEEAMEE